MYLNKMYINLYNKLACGVHSLWAIIIEVATARFRTIFITRNTETVLKVLISLPARDFIQILFVCLIFPIS